MEYPLVKPVRPHSRRLAQQSAWRTRGLARRTAAQQGRLTVRGARLPAHQERSAEPVLACLAGRRVSARGARAGLGVLATTGTAVGRSGGDRPGQRALGQRLRRNGDPPPVEFRPGPGVELGNRRGLRLRLHVHDAVALGLQLGQQARQRPRRRGLDVVEQDDALSASAPGRPSPCDARCRGRGSGSPCCPRRWRRCAMWRSCRWMVMDLGSRRKGKRKNGAIGLPIACCTALKPSSISARALSGVSACRLACDQVCVPTVCPRRAYSLHHLRIGDGHAPDDEEGRLGAMRGKGVEHGHGVGAQRPVVEGQHHLAVGKKARLLVLEAKEGPGAGVDLDDPRDAERIGGRNGGRARLLAPCAGPTRPRPRPEQGPTP